MLFELAAAGANIFNQIQQGNLANDQARLQAQIDDWQADIEQENGLKQAAIIRRAGRAQVGQANAAYAASGVKVGEGSALETERQINQDVEHDAFQTLLQSGRRARGLQLNATMTRIQGSMAQKAGYVNAANSVLSAGFQAYSGWKTSGTYNYNGDANGAKFSASGADIRARR